MRLFFSILLFQLANFSFGQTLYKNDIDADSLFSAQAKKAIGKPFPKFFAANDKFKINNDSLMGKVVLINFWFEGCHPCLAEFGGLNDLADTLKNNKDFEFISFTWDNEETIKKVQRNYQLQFSVFLVDTKECRRLNLNNGFPTTFILNKQGVIKYFHIGGSTDSVKAKEFVMTTLLQEIKKEL